MGNIKKRDKVMNLWEDYYAIVSGSYVFFFSD